MCEDMEITVNNDRGLLDTLTSTAGSYGLSALQTGLQAGITNQLDQLAINF
jgi:hypothetical protein